MISESKSKPRQKGLPQHNHFVIYISWERERERGMEGERGALGSDDLYMDIMYHYYDTRTSEYVVDIIMLIAGGGVACLFLADVSC